MMQQAMAGAVLLGHYHCCWIVSFSFSYFYPYHLFLFGSPPPPKLEKILFVSDSLLVEEDDFEFMLPSSLEEDELPSLEFPLGFFSPACQSKDNGNNNGNNVREEENDSPLNSVSVLCASFISYVLFIITLTPLL
mmetsp:Transcript_66452/g.98511  ORF Transcript_66452/g.98511 Transcript_66452/m.98511 type:complete len:135 (-) Transcript_66452:501-905(-)